MPHRHLREDDLPLLKLQRAAERFIRQLDQMQDFPTPNGGRRLIFDVAADVRTLRTWAKQTLDAKLTNKG